MNETPSTPDLSEPAMMFAAAAMPLVAPISSGVRRLDLAGLTDYRGMREAVVTLARDGSLAKEQPVLIDLRDLRFLPTSPEAEAFADELSGTDTLGSHPVALLVRLGSQYGMARMMCTMAELRGGKVRSFIDDRAAVEWLLG